MAEGWDLVAEQRNVFADLIEPLDDEQAATPSLCEGWTVHETAAHLLTSQFSSPRRLRRSGPSRSPPMKPNA